MTPDIKYQTLVCNIPDATVAGIYPFSIHLEQDYDFAKGVAVYKISDGNLTKTTMGIRSRDGKVYQDRTIIADYLTSDAVPQDRRYKEFGGNMIAKGKEIIVDIETFDSTSSEAEYQLVFQLVKEIN